MQLTAEQVCVVRSRARRLTVQAGAGAAKTTTLGAYADARRGSRVLYLAFNKAIQLEAAARMPSNVTCRTTHSIAWRKARQLFGEQAGDRIGATYPSTVAKVLGCSALVASGALQAVQRWCGSLDPRIELEHVPLDIAMRLADPAVAVRVAREVWLRMTDACERDLKLPHDGYLKLFQMDRPALRGYDVIAVDEAQDLNPCTFDIVRSQSVPIAMVGDAAQAIYSFRGATNALALFDAQERLPLTRSFRFGRGIASLANSLLSGFKADFSLPLVGAGEPQETRLAIDTRRPFALIARTNAAVFEEAVGFLALGRRYHFVGGIDGYKLEKILDAYQLWIGERALIRDPYLRSFSSFDELCELAEDSDDRELKHLVRAVQDYGHQVSGLVEEIKARHVDVRKEDWRQFDGIFLCTAHKSKGLEFDQVWLADDYMRFFDKGRELEADEVEQEEVNILYVALTRAKAAIRLCTSFEEWLLHRDLMPA